MILLYQFKKIIIIQTGSSSVTSKENCGTDEDCAERLIRREKQLIKIMYSKEEKLIYTTTLMNFAPLILLWLCFHIH